MLSQTVQPEPTTPSPSEEDINSRIKDQQLLAMVDAFLESIGTERGTVPMTELTDFALDLRNVITQ